MAESYISQIFKEKIYVIEIFKNVFRKFSHKSNIYFMLI